MKSFLNTQKIIKYLPLLLVVLVVLIPADLLADKVIGQEALDRKATAGGHTVNINDSIASIGSMLKLMLGIVSLLVFVALALASKVTDFKLFPTWKTNTLNAYAFIVFLIVGGALATWELIVHSGKAGPSASVHGESMDQMFMVTTIVCGIVFVLTQVLLFSFAYMYRGRPGNTALFYPENHKLELIWTLIPAVTLTIMVFWGMTIWMNYHKDAPKDSLQIEIVGQQFEWNIRHSGKDNVLAKANFKEISGLNMLGVSYKEKAAEDDIILPAKEIHIPVNKSVKFNIRSKDVLHGVYAPQFRVQVYAVPGMPTAFSFVPKTTTADMRKITKNPKFNYELACSQLCGSGHWNMRVVIVVDTPEEYQKWLDSQKPTFTPDKIQSFEDEKALKLAQAGPVVNTNSSDHKEGETGDMKKEEEAKSNTH